MPRTCPRCRAPPSLLLTGSLLAVSVPNKPALNLFYTTVRLSCKTCETYIPAAWFISLLRKRSRVMNLASYYIGRCSCC